MKIITCLVLTATLSVSTMQGADAVQWEDLPKKIGHGSHRYRVVTKDGQTYTAHELLFSPTGVGLSNAGPFVPREKVTEIRIHRFREPLSQTLVAPIGAVIGHDVVSYNPLEDLFLVPASFVFTAAAAPIVLATHGVKRLLPDKVIKVAL